MIRLSHDINKNTPTYGNRSKITIKQSTNKVDDYFITESKWEFTTNHLGTHIDAPLHFIKDGMSVTDFDDSFWFFENVEVIDIKKDNGELIEWEEIEPEVKNIKSI